MSSSKKPQATLGKQEGRVLSFVAQNAPVTSREVSLHFDEQSGLARTTILTMINRLLAKGFLDELQDVGWVE